MAEFLLGETGASLPEAPKLYDMILRLTLLICPPPGVKICRSKNNTRWAAARSSLVFFCSKKPPNGYTEAKNEVTNFRTIHVFEFFKLRK